jgi:hypothetical protein
VVQDVKGIAQQFLCPTAHLVNGSIIFQNFLDSAAVVQTIEFGAPQVFSVLANGPAAIGCLANKGMVVLLRVRASSGTKPDWTKMGAFQGEIELHSPVCRKWSRAAMDSGESSGCMRMKPNAFADQSVFRKHGLLESKRASNGELTMS